MIRYSERLVIYLVRFLFYHQNTRTMMSIFNNSEISEEFNEGLFQIIVQEMIAIDHQHLKFVLINGLEIIEEVGEKNG